MFASLVGLLFVLWFVGYVENFWTGVGLITLLGVLAVLQKLERLRRFATLLFISWAILFLVLPQVFRSLPLTEQELMIQRQIADLRRAEELHIPGDRALRVLRLWCNDVENSIIKEITLQYRNRKKDLTSIIDAFIKSTGGLEIARDEELRNRIIALQEYRAKCGQFILERSKINAVPGLEAWHWATILLTIVFVTSFLARGAAKDEGTKNFAAFFEVTAQAALVGGFILWLALGGGLIFLLQSFASMPLVAKFGILVFSFYAGTKATRYEKIRWLGFMIQVFTVGFGIAYWIYWTSYTPDPATALNQKWTQLLKIFGL